MTEDVSHPVIGIMRRRVELMPVNSGRVYSEMKDFENDLNDKLASAEPALAHNPPSTVPDLLQAKAYLDGVGAWYDPSKEMTPKEIASLSAILGDGWRDLDFFAYSEKDAMGNYTRTINDQTVLAEILELRDAFVDRSLRAGSKDQTERLAKSYRDDLLIVLTGAKGEGLRPLGDKFDARLMEARADYKKALLRRAGNDGGHAFQDYREALLQIIFDFLKEHDKEIELRDRKPEIVVKRTAEPAPALPTSAPLPARPRVELIDTSEIDDKPQDRGRFHGLERTEPPAPARAPMQDAVADSRARRDERTSTAWQQSDPLPPKRKKRRSADPVE